LSAAAPFVVPSAALELSVSPVAAWCDGSRLSRSAAIFVESKVRSFGLSGFGGGVAACCFGGGFFSSFFRVSAIGSFVSGFFSTGLGSSFGLASATGFGGSGFFSTGFSTGFGCGGGAVSVTTGAFSVTFPTASDFPSCPTSCRR
jgi:hypothetical protein